MKQLLPAIVFGIVLASSSGCVVEPVGFWHQGYWHEGCCAGDHERERSHEHHDNGRGHGDGEGRR